METVNAISMTCGFTKVLPSTSLSSQDIKGSKLSAIRHWLGTTGSAQTFPINVLQLLWLLLPTKLSNGGRILANLTATNTSTAASVDFHFTYPIHGVTKIEAAFDSPSGVVRRDFFGYNARPAGATNWRSAKYIYSAIPRSVLLVLLNQNGFNAITILFLDSELLIRGTYILVNGRSTLP